jgi:hypothetical protein
LATIYVYSGAGGTNNGVSWGNAYTSAAAAYDVWTVGDEIWVADDHTEAVTATHNIGALNTTTADIMPVFRMNRSTNVLSVSTGIDTRQYNLTDSLADLTFGNSTDNVYASFVGMFFAANDNIEIDQDDISLYFDQCYFLMTSSGGRFETGNESNNGSSYSRIKNSTLEFPITGNIRQQGVYQEFENCTFKGVADATGLFRASDSSQTISWVTGCDFSQITMPILVDTDDGFADSANVWHFIACKFTDGQVIHDSGIGTDGSFIYVHNSDGLGNTYIVEKYGYRGDITTDIATYYTGADNYIDCDQNKPLSRKMTPSVNLNVGRSLESVEIYGIFNNTGANTLTIELLENFTAALTKRECWLEVFYLGGTSSTKWFAAADREFAALTYTNLAVGSGIGSWILPTAGSRSAKVSTAVNVLKAGMYKAVLHVAKYEAGKQVNYNPKITIT